MAKVTIPQFSGLRPSASELRLDAVEAVFAQDVSLRRGLLAPRSRQRTWSSVKNNPHLPVYSTNDPETIFRFRNRATSTDYWMYWTTDVDVAPGPVANVSSSDQRHYFTGDGLPKEFTAASINDATPDYGGSPDNKYPYAWFYLGVPAPTVAPSVDASEYTPPDAALSGSIESVFTTTLLMEHTYWHSSSSYWRGSKPSEGQTTSVIDPDGNGVGLQILAPGTRVRVASIVDADHVTIEGMVAGGYACPVVENDYGLRWNTTSGNNIMTLWVREGRTSKWDFRVPNGAVVEITAHTLEVGDILRTTTATTPMVWYSTVELLATPNNNPLQRVIEPVPDADITFNGNVGYVIERGGSVIDPSVVDTVLTQVTTRSYVYTWVTHLGEESPPSPPTDPISIRVGDSVGLDTFGTPPTDHRIITNVRIYRASTGTEATEFQLVDEVAYSGGMSYIDNKSDSELGELLPSETWDIPNSTMQGIIALPNGACAGFFDNVWCLSEAGYGHAWPEDYQHYLDFPIVGNSPIGQSVVILTTGNPYVASGAHPRQMSVRKTDVRHPCLDKRSIVNTGDTVMYCSPTGLVRVTTQSADNVTEEHYTKDAWSQVVGPDLATARNLRAWFFDDQYILYARYTLDAVNYDTRLVFDFKNGKAEITSFSDTIDAGFYDPGAGEFFYVPVSSDANSYPTIVGSLPGGSKPLLRWDYIHPDTNAATGYTTGTWKSKTFAYKSPISPAAARVICRRLRLNGSYNAYGLVRVDVYGVRYGVWDTASNVLVDETILVSSANLITGQPSVGGWAGEHRSDPFRINVNALFDAMRVEIIVAGPVEVESATIAEAMEELMET